MKNSWLETVSYNWPSLIMFCSVLSFYNPIFLRGMENCELMKQTMLDTKISTSLIHIFPTIINAYMPNIKTRLLLH